jgi:hypothetical protein
MLRDFMFDGRVWRDGMLQDPMDGKRSEGIHGLSPDGALQKKGFSGIGHLDARLSHGGPFRDGGDRLPIVFENPHVTV